MAEIEEVTVDADGNTTSTVTHSLDVLAEVASDALAKDPELKFGDGTKLTKRQAEQLEFFHLEHLCAITDSTMLALFSQQETKEMSKNITVRCMLMPDDCQKVVSTYANERKANSLMLEHLKKHIQDLIRKAQEPKRGKPFEFKTESIHARRLRLQGGRARSRRRCPSPSHEVVVKTERKPRARAGKREPSAPAPPQTEEELEFMEEVQMLIDVPEPAVPPPKSAKKGRKGKTSAAKQLLEVNYYDEFSPEPEKRRSGSAKKKTADKSPAKRKAGKKKKAAVDPDDDEIPAPPHADHEYMHQKGDGDKTGEDHGDGEDESMDGYGKEEEIECEEVIDDFAAGDVTMTARAPMKIRSPKKETRDILDIAAEADESSQYHNIEPLSKLDRIPLVVTDQSSALFGNTIIGAQEVVGTSGENEFSDGTGVQVLDPLMDGYRGGTTGKRMRLSADDRYSTICIDRPQTLILEEEDGKTTLVEARPNKYERSNHPPMPRCSSAHGGRIDLTEDMLINPEDEHELDQLEKGSPEWERKFALHEIWRLKRNRGSNLSPTCKICCKTMGAISSLMTHYRSHAGIKPYVCMLCKASFTRQHSLNYHMLIHNNLTRFRCDYCGREFRHPSHYKEHVRSHTGEAPFGCVYCHERLRTRNNLKRHLRIKHGKALTAEGIFDLPEAEIIAQQMIGRKGRGQQLMTADGELINILEFPANNSSGSEAVSTKVVVPFCCVYCGELFTSSAVYKNHLELMHPAGSRSQPSSAGARRPRSYPQPIVLTTKIPPEATVISDTMTGEQNIRIVPTHQTTMLSQSLTEPSPSPMGATGQTMGMVTGPGGSQKYLIRPGVPVSLAKGLSGGQNIVVVNQGQPGAGAGRVVSGEVGDAELNAALESLTDSLQDTPGDGPSTLTLKGEDGVYEVVAEEAVVEESTEDDGGLATSLQQATA